MFRLALSLGRHVEEIERLPAATLAEWAAYCRLEPFGPEPWRDDTPEAAPSAKTAEEKQRSMAQAVRAWIGMMPKGKRKE